MKQTYKFGFKTKEKYLYKAEKGLSEKVVTLISKMKNEPDWMYQKRLTGYKHFLEKSMPTWGGDLSKIDFEQIHYYVKPDDKVSKTWEEVPKEIKETYDKLGIPEAEKQYLGGVKAQYESEVIYGSLQKKLSDEGVVFLGMDEALVKYPELIKEYFGKVVPAGDNKFAALNTAVWSGGSFIYVPKGLKVELPLQAYFRINTANMGQFERTLIIVDEGAFVHYIEGCFLKGAMVETSLGEKKIEEIKIGDNVLTHKSRYRTVYATNTRKYEGDIYSITYYGDSSRQLNITEEHPLLVARRGRVRDRNKFFKVEWIMAKDVRHKDYLVMPRKQYIENDGILLSAKVLVNGNENKLEISNNGDIFRFFGYFLAEGYVDKEHYVTISFNSSEVIYINDANRIAESMSGKKMIKNKIRQHGQTLVLCSTLWARLIAKEFYDEFGQKKIPDWVWNANNVCLGELVKGMWRGDGTFDKKKNYFRYSSTNKLLAYGFREMLLRLGILSGINFEKRKLPRKNMYQVVIYSPFNEMFGNLVGLLAKNGKSTGSPVSMTRDYVFCPIRSIKKKKVMEDVYNFSVKDDESYVAEGVVSHNCTAPIYTTDSLHAAVVEIFVKKNARCRYTTIQNWSNNVYNLVTKRTWVEAGGVMEWVDGNLGSKLTMKYPSVILAGEGARGEVLSIAVAGEGQHQDAGGKCIHLAPNTSSRIISKSISMDGGRASYRGLIQINPGAKNARSKVVCDALILDKKSRSDTYPTNKLQESSAVLEHEATVSKIGEDQLFYLQSRGFSQAEAETMVVNGFIEPIVKELPMEYAVELNRLIGLQMEGSVG